MNKIKTLLALVALVMSFAFTAQAQTKKNSKETEITYAIKIHCESCKKKIEATVPYIKGVKDFKVDMKDQKVWIKYDNSKINKESLTAEVKKLGYGADEVIVKESDKK